MNGGCTHEIGSDNCVDGRTTNHSDGLVAGSAFRDITEKRIRRGTFRNVKELKSAIM